MLVSGPADNIPVGAPSNRGKHSLSSQADPRRQRTEADTSSARHPSAGESDRYRARPRFNPRPYASRHPRGAPKIQHRDRSARLRPSRLACASPPRQSSVRAAPSARGRRRKVALPHPRVAVARCGCCSRGGAIVRRSRRQSTPMSRGCCTKVRGSHCSSNGGRRGASNLSIHTTKTLAHLQTRRGRCMPTSSMLLEIPSAALNSKSKTLTATEVDRLARSRTLVARLVRCFPP